MFRDRSVWNLILVIVGVTIWLGYTVLGGGHPRPTARPRSHEVDYWVDRFRSSYGITVVYASSIKLAEPATYDLAPVADDERLARFLTVVYFELGRYSPHYLHTMKLGTIGVYRNVVDRGIRTWVPLPTESTLLIDYDDHFDNVQLASHSLHHELLHYMMVVTHGYHWDDPIWESCNPPGFHYGNGGANDRDPNSGILNHPQPGFVDHYAMSSIDEDMAEIEACRWVPSQNARLTEWRKTDPYLDRKYKRLLEILQPYQ